MKYSAALIGGGSEILGYDDPQSTDHNWGARNMIFLSEKDYLNLNRTILETLTKEIPDDFIGYSTKINCFTIQSFFEKYLGIDSFTNLEISDWLNFPSQKLLEVTNGKIYHDDLNLQECRKQFFYYPHDIWLYILSCQWIKIAQEEAFVGRCGFVGDELGSQIVAARIVRELMKLCFLLEKRYAPYSKWIGTAFGELALAKELLPIFRKVLLSETWQEREKYFSQAYEKLAELHNSKQITAPLPTQVSPYYDRQYLIIHANHFAEAIKNRIKDENIKAIQTNMGSIDQFVDSTDVLAHPQIFKKMRSFLESQIWGS